MNGTVGTREEVQEKPQEEQQQQSPFVTASDMLSFSEYERDAMIFNEIRALRIELSQTKR